MVLGMVINMLEVPRLGKTRSIKAKDIVKCMVNEWHCGGVVWLRSIPCNNSRLRPSLKVRVTRIGRTAIPFAAHALNHSLAHRLACV